MYHLAGFAFGSERIKTSEVEPRSRHLAAALHRLGVNKDDVVQLYMPNNCDFHIFVFACWICGAVPSLTDPGEVVCYAQGAITPFSTRVALNQFCVLRKLSKFKHYIFIMNK